MQCDSSAEYCSSVEPRHNTIIMDSCLTPTRTCKHTCDSLSGSQNLHVFSQGGRSRNPATTSGRLCCSTCAAATTAAAASCRQLRPALSPVQSQPETSQSAGAVYCNHDKNTEKILWSVVSSANIYIITMPGTLAQGHTRSACFRLQDDICQ